MSFHLLGPRGTPDLDLGDWFKLAAAWKELAAHHRAAGGEDGVFQDLWAVPFTNEEPVTNQDLVKLRAQATMALRMYRSGLSPHARWVLEQLTGAGGADRV